MRRVSPVLSVLLSTFLGLASGCGDPQFAGLGDDLDVGGVDDTSTADDTAGDETLFPVDDTATTDSGPSDDAADASPPDDSAASDVADAADTHDDGIDVADVGTDTADAGSDSGADTGTDTGVDSGTDTGADVGSDTADSAPVDAGTDAPADTTPDTPADTGGPLWPNEPGKVTCNGTQCDKTCCGYLGFSGWGWSCASSCIAGRTYDCDQKADCSGGKVCCTSTNLVGTVNGSGCQDSCGGDSQLCATSAECTGGKTCKAYMPPDVTWSFGSCQ